MHLFRSDGPQPHLITAQFHRLTRVKEVALFLDYTLDESYTPHEVAIYAATDYQNMRLIKQLAVEEPEGWILIDLSDTDRRYAGMVLGREPEAANERVSPLHRWVYATELQIAILSNHQNGKDSHVRQVKVFAPQRYNSIPCPLQT